MQRLVLRVITKFLLFLLLISPSISAAVDLIETWQSARHYDASILGAQAALAAGQEKGSQGLAGLLPQARVSAHTSRQNDHYENTTQVRRLSGYQFSANQVIYDQSRYTDYQQGKKSTQKAQIQFKSAQQILMIQVAQAYLATLLATEHVQQINAQKEAITDQIKQAKISFELGITTITDYNETQAKYDGIVAAEIAAKNALIIKQNALQQFAPIDIDQLSELDNSFIPIPLEPEDLESWLTKAQQNNLQIQEKKLDLEIAKNEIEKYRLLKSPTINLEAGVSRNDMQHLESVKRHNSSVSLVVTVPLSTGGYRSSKLRESSALAEFSQQQLTHTMRQVRLETQTAFLGVTSGISQISALKQALQSSQTLLKSTTLGREVGIRTTEDILNAQQKYYNTQYQLVEAEINYLIDRLKLAASVGTLQEEDLQVINRWLVKKA